MPELLIAVLIFILCQTIFIVGYLYGRNDERKSQGR